MSKIIAIGTAVPAYRHAQDVILPFMQRVYAMNEVGNRKLKFLYHQSGIETRYSVIPDYSLPIDAWEFYPRGENLDPFPSLEKRMEWFNKYAPPLSVSAISDCLKNAGRANEDITHLITVSCTGMSAPGLDLQVLELMDLPKNIYRTSVNFMGCYAAIHAMKMADAICKSTAGAKVMIVCTELCTLHFQREATPDSLSSSLLFGDGSAAALIVNDDEKQPGLYIKDFYAEVVTKGKSDMAWQLSSSGFLMSLSGYIPELIAEDFAGLLERASAHAGISSHDINQWCIHPGGRRILDSIHRSLSFKNGELANCYDVLKNHGNMSSPTILFVLKKLMDQQILTDNKNTAVFGAAFGPGLTMETFMLSEAL